MYLPIFYLVSWAVGEIPYFLIATLAVVRIGNGMAGIETDSASEFLMYWLVLFTFTLCVTYFGMMVTFLAPMPTLAAFIVSIVTSLWVSTSRVVVLLSDRIQGHIFASALFDGELGNDDGRRRTSSSESVLDRRQWEKERQARSRIRVARRSTTVAEQREESEEKVLRNRS
ncbi:ABC transporter G family member 31 [Camellia lanceoleosa]|uniref:ABC transporter G family member 31 n=1 Tax=Camellia lanceoleosa TaxID=1840588 RepID=A0ACC0G5F4_9ERIC|nr:ABC transporter G family member 31 [Camellia lanceoleosa]